LVSFSSSLLHVHLLRFILLSLFLQFILLHHLRLSLPPSSLTSSFCLLFSHLFHILCYKQEGRDFDTQRGDFYFNLPNLSGRNSLRGLLCL
jgi:hypothetical protein